MSLEKISPRRPSGPGRLSAEQMAELPDRILDAALALFIEDGYAGTTMERIARKAGASTKTIYARYGNKEEILGAVVARLQDRTIAQFQLAAPPDPRGLDAHAYLTAMGLGIIDGITTDSAGLIRLALSEGHRFPELGKLFLEATGRGEAIIRRGLEAWSAEGRLPDLHDDFGKAAGLCLTMLAERARLRAVIGKPMSREEAKTHVDLAVRTFLRSCGYKFAA